MRHRLIAAALLTFPIALLPGCASKQLSAFEKPVEKWIEDLSHKDPEIRSRAAEALRELGGRARSAVHALADSLSDPDVIVRRNSALALSSLGQEASKALPELRTALERDVDSGVRLVSAYTIGKLGHEGEAGIPELSRRLDDEDDIVGLAAVDALGRLSDDSPAAVSALEVAPESRSSAVKSAFTLFVRGFQPTNRTSNAFQAMLQRSKARLAKVRGASAQPTRNEQAVRNVMQVEIERRLAAMAEVK